MEEYPLLVLPSLAVSIGLNQAIVVQQVHYWLTKSKHHRDGRRWVYNSYEAWQSGNFPFWSVATVKRTFQDLERNGILLTGNYNRLQIDRTKWYSINYDHPALQASTLDEQREAEEMASRPLVQNDPMDDASEDAPSAQTAPIAGAGSSRPSAQDDPMDGARRATGGGGLTSPLPETTAETTPDTPSETPSETSQRKQQQQQPSGVVVGSSNEEEGFTEELAAELAELGITPAEASRLAVDSELADGWLAWLSSLPADERPARPAGFLVKKLRDKEPPPPPRNRFRFPRR